MATFLHLCANNDYNGNPQRAYVLTNEAGEYVAAWDEGYLGSDAVPGVWRREAYAADRLAVTVREYKRVLKQLPSPAWDYEVPGYAR